MAADFEGIFLSGSSEEISEEEKEKRLVDINNASCVGTWGGNEEGLLQISLPHGCNLVGSVDVGNKRAEVRSVFTGNIAGHGIGARLMQSFIAEAKVCGAQHLVFRDIISPGGLQLTVSVFGADNVRFFTRPRGSSEDEGIEISHNEAEKFITEQHSSSQVPQRTIDAEVSLDGINTDDWQRPTLGNTKSPQI
jgi:hypothetical protein